jgi:N4-gp56 family major capsid protein
MGEKPVWQDGFNTLAWTRVDKLTVSASTALLTESTTPTETNLTMTTITMTPNQYGLFVTLSDLLIDVSPIQIISNASKVVWENLARIVDSVIQATLLSTVTNAIYGGTAVNRAAIAAWDVITASNLAKANAFLSTKSAPTFDDSYVAVMHPNCIYDLQMQSGTGTFIDLVKYTSAVQRAFMGEIGMLYWVRIVKSSYVQTVASTVTVYPTYVMGKGAYGVAELQAMRSYITPRSPSDSDPLAQRVKIGSKVAFNSIVLQQDAIVRIETSSSLSYSW